MAFHPTKLVLVLVSLLSVSHAFQVSSSFLSPLVPRTAATTMNGGKVHEAAKSCLRMQQSGFNEFDDDPQYSMDSLTYSDNVPPPQAEFSIPMPPPSKSDEPFLSDLKLRVLMACSGLDRGSAADEDQRSEVEAAVKALESEAAGASDFPEGFDGKWRLVYTSALSPGSESGGGAGANSLPFFQTPAPAARLSFGGRGQVGQVYQNVDVRRGRLDNVVEVQAPGPLPLGKTTLSLEHKLEFIPGSPKRSKITLVNVAVDGPLKQLGLQPINIPVLEAISSQGAGVFDTTFCDEEVRIARGDRGELRVFVKR